MSSPHLTPDQLAEISSLVAGYIKAQRERALPLALPLDPAQRASMDGFFLPQVLDTRLLVLTGTRVENPSFYVPLRRMGFTNLPSFSTMAALTFCDVVVSHQPFSDGLLFHELVHVEQYRQLGIQRFAELYVRGFLSGGGYVGIPLEVNACELGGRLESSPLARFSVADEVAVWVRDGRFGAFNGAPARAMLSSPQEVYRALRRRTDQPILLSRAAVNAAKDSHQRRT